MSKRLVILVLLMLAVLVLWFMDLLLGPKGFTRPEGLAQVTWDALWQNFSFYQIRWPRALTATMAGAGLAVAGLQMQTVFRNPLAGPYVLGISSGASLGVALLLLGSTALGFAIQLHAWWALVLAAVFGASVLMLVVLAVSARIQSSVTLLVLGILFGGAIGSLVGLLQYFSAPQALKQFVIWTMGSLHGVDAEQLKWLATMIVLGVLPAIFQLKALNLMLLPEGDAQSLGLRVRFSRTWILLSAGILAGGITGFVGPIGFVGLVAPHMARYAFRTSNHRWLLPASALMGAFTLLAADILSLLPGGGKVLPINSVSSLLGVPMVIALLWQSRNLQSN